MNEHFNATNLRTHWQHIFQKARLLHLSAILCLFVLCACSDNDYINAIPGNSPAIVALDASEMSESSTFDSLKEIFGGNDLAKSGIDFKSRVFLFETIDGNFGLCAKVTDKGCLKKFVGNMAKSGMATNAVERNGFLFTDLKKSWAVGFSEKALVVIGPVTATSMSDTWNTIARLLKQDEDFGIKASPLYTALDSLKSPIALVARANALPDKISAFLTLGLPENASTSQVIVAAEASVKGDKLAISGRIFSDNANIDKALRKSQGVYRPIGNTFFTTLSDKYAASLYANVDGKAFLPLMQSNKALQALLAGLNMAVDLNLIINSIDGNMVVASNAHGAAQDITFAAQLSTDKWLDEVGYWKTSCPAGARIVDAGAGCYQYTDGKSAFFFGSTDKHKFYCGSNLSLAQFAASGSVQPQNNEIAALIKGKRIALVVNTDAALASFGDDPEGQSLRKQLFGNVKNIVYTMK